MIKIFLKSLITSILLILVIFFIVYFLLISIARAEEPKYCRNGDYIELCEECENCVIEIKRSDT